MVVITVKKEGNSNFRVKFIVEYQLVNGEIPDPMRSPEFSTGTETLNISEDVASMGVTIFVKSEPSSSSVEKEKMIFYNKQFASQFNNVTDLNIEVKGNFNDPDVIVQHG